MSYCPTNPTLWLWLYTFVWSPKCHCHEKFIPESIFEKKIKKWCSNCSVWQLSGGPVFVQPVASNFGTIERRSHQIQPAPSQPRYSPAICSPELIAAVLDSAHVSPAARIHTDFFAGGGNVLRTSVWRYIGKKRRLIIWKTLARPDQMPTSRQCNLLFDGPLPQDVCAITGLVLACQSAQDRMLILVYR